jgi:putative hydrolase of HD superfamily
MREIINFLLEVSKLKTEPRSGWVLAEVKKPETIAEHSFRVAIVSWIFAEREKLNVKRAILIALFHDICEVYAGDITPFIYYPNLPNDREKRKKMLMKWVRLTKEEKLKRGQMKFKKEKKGLQDLIKPLTSDLKNEIFSFWLDYERGISKEGKFVNQLNRIETLLQSIDYFGTKDVKTRTNWWEWTEEIVDDPLLLKFLKTIQNKFYGKTSGYKHDKELEGILDFVIEIGKLKKMSRLYWILREVKNPETVASHMFDLALMAWVFNKEKKFNMEKILKMAFCHEISAVYTGDTTPYDRILPKTRKDKREILQRWPHIPKEKKQKIFIADYKEEKKAMEKLTKRLEPSIRNEMLQLWKEYRIKSTPEGRFLSQINVLAVLMQSLLYEKGNRNFSASPIWEWAFEACDNDACFRFLDGLKEKFNKPR